MPTSSVLSPSVLCLTVHPPPGLSYEYIPSTPCSSCSFQPSALQFPLTRLSSPRPPRLSSKLAYPPAEPPLVQLVCAHSTLRTPACIPALNMFTHVALVNWELLEGRNYFLIFLFSSQHSTSTILSNDKCLWVLYKLHCTVPQDNTTCSHASILVADHRPEDVSVFPHMPGCAWVTGVRYLFCSSSRVSSLTGWLVVMIRDLLSFSIPS